MPEYLSPGVYVEEVSSGSRPIEGVSTTTAAFVGPTERGPLAPRLVTSWLDYQRWFGSYVDPQIYSKPMEAYTPYGVEGFFTNGGQRAYIARVVHDTDLVPANNSQTATLALATEDAKVQLEVRAIGPGNWGGNLLLKLDPGSEAEPTNDDTKNLFRLTVLYYQNGVPQPFVDPTLAANQASPYFQAPDVSEAFDNLTIDPTATNDVLTVVNRGSKLVRVGFIEKPTAGFGAGESETAAEPAWPEMPPAASGRVKVQVENEEDASILLTARQPGVWGNQVQFAFEAGNTEVEPATPGKLQLAWGFNPDEESDDGYAFVDANSEEYSTEMSLDDLIAAINARSKLVSAAEGEGAGQEKGALTGGTGTSIQALELPSEENDEPATASALVQLTPDEELELEAQFEGPLGDDIGFQAAVTDPSVDPEERRLTLRYPSNLGGTYVEAYDYTADSIEALKTNLAKSGLVQVKEVPSSASGGGEGEEGETPAPGTPLGGGSSQGWFAGGAPPLPEEPNPTPADFEGGGTPPDLTGLVGVGEIDGISMLVAPDAVNPKIANNKQISLALIEQCELLKDRFAVLSVEEGESQVTNIRPIQDTSFGATYYPWIRIYNPRTDGTLLVPPVGHVTGLYARNDIEKGVQHAPANEVLGGLYLSGDNPENGPLEFLIGKAQQDILNPRGIDVIRDFRPMGRGVRVWGARTMSSDPEWRYVNVRRLFLFVEQSIEQGTQWVVFEPNVEATWAAVVTSISGFLDQVWRSGGLAGTSPEEAYFVKCDRTTMTQDDIDNGRLICLVGIAPVKPAEFVIIRIGQKTLEAA